MRGQEVDARKFWLALAESDRFTAAPVSAFQHAPVAKQYDNYVRIGTVVEVPHVVVAGSVNTVAYWYACVVRKVGYFVKLRWIGAEHDPSKDFWRNCAFHRKPGKEEDLRIHAYGYSRQSKLSLEPPRFLGWIRRNLQEFLDSKASAGDVLDRNLHVLAHLENLGTVPCGTNVTTINVKNPREKKDARVETSINRRLKLRYHDDVDYRYPFWYHEKSDMYRLAAKDDAIIDDEVTHTLNLWREAIGSKLEVVDPVRPLRIHVGTLREVHEDQDLSISFDGTDRWVRLRMTSHFLLPAGFAASHDFMGYLRPLRTDPRAETYGYENAKKVPRHLVHRTIKETEFKEGQFLELFGIPDLEHVFVGRIERVVGHLLAISTEALGTREIMFLLPVTSTDIYPIGWCDLVGINLRFFP